MIFTMMAAHDTSTISAAMIGYYLAVHPEWQERLREESRALGRTITHEDSPTSTRGIPFARACTSASA